MAEKSQINNKRIASNTMMLYFRMLFMMLIGLYTSRVILDKLGEVDYGVYDVVAGFVTTFSVVSGAMTSATQRFISFEIGKGKDGDVKSIFSTMIIIHLFLAGIIIVLAETFGLWFLNNKMNIPIDRYVAVNWVFQFSLISFLINVISVPYNAALIAYEKMSAFAWMTILDSILKLLICYLITTTSIDKLVVYAFLMAVIAIIDRILYGVYCSRKISDCKNNWSYNKTYVKEVFSYVSWNLIGSLSIVGREHGVNVVLNIFFGATVNAARGVAYQVLSKVQGFVSNFQLALNPQIIKSYSSGEYEAMYKLVFRGAKFSYLLMMVFVIPIYIELPTILNIWLVDVPDYTVVFTRLVLLTSMLASLSNPLIISVHASGVVRDYQLVVGGISLLTLPIVCVAFYLKADAYYAMIIGLVMEFICHLARLIMLGRIMDFPVYSFLLNVTLRVFIINVLAFLPPLFLSCQIDIPIVRFVVVCVSSFICSIVFSFYLGFQKSEQMLIKEKLTSKVLSKFSRK